MTARADSSKQMFREHPLCDATLGAVEETLEKHIIHVIKTLKFYWS